MWSRLCLTVLVYLMGVSAASAEHYFVRTQAEYAAAARKVVAGDIIILANGEWRDFEVVLTGKGTPTKPITLISEEPGKVILSGQSNLRIGGEYILVTGLVFRDGYSPTGEVISFRRTKEDLANNSRVTEVVIDHFNKPDRYESDYWVGMYGRNNRFDHNYLVGKSNKGVTLAVRLDSRESRKNRHRIDFNYFGPRPVLGSNGGETLRIGTSQYSMYDSETLVENNVFDRCDGEVEIISSKSGGNIYRGNLFLQSRGTLTLRHGDGNLVEDNVFLGGGKDHTGGIRVINRKQTVRNNYLEGLAGSGFSSALTVMNGVPNSPVNRYVQVEDAVIERNTIVDSRRITLGAGADAERSAPPVSSSFSHNLLAGSSDGELVAVEADVSGISFAGNALLRGRAAQPLAGFVATTATLVRAENGLLYPDDPALAKTGASRDLKPVRLEEAGPAWYPKPGTDDVFSGGQAMSVTPGEDGLTQAVLAAGHGDVLQLEAGEHLVNKVLALNKAITLQGPATENGETAARIRFTRPSLFELREGGNLRLSRLAISGELAPDSVGNAVIRTTSFPLQSNFVIELDQVAISNLLVNAAFNVIAIGKSAMADRISITNSQFTDISGAVVQAAAETEDYGQYNVEHLQISASGFRNVGREAVNVYRGGRDESTFGPHVRLERLTFENVGTSTRNSSGASIVLHGVQVSHIDASSFRSSAPVKIIHTVGEPQTAITNNRFDDTPVPVIEELVWRGPARVELSGNTSMTAPVK